MHSLCIKSTIYSFYFFCIFTEDEETCNIIALMCLPFQLSVSSSKGRKSKNLWRPSKFEIRHGLIIHVLSNAEVEEMFTRKRHKLVGLGHTLQPFVIIVGSS